MPGTAGPDKTAPPAHAMDADRGRRCSNASDTSLEEGAVRKLSVQHDGTEFIPTRSSKVAPPKPAANPLQFIKVGPCDLYKSAQEQIKRVEEVKRIKETVKEEAEDWQSNLDNWKCSRRKRQEHIIERVVEVKKMEMEEHDRNRRRSKTFSEMMEDRNTRGRKTSLMVYKDDEANDLSDLGIGTSSGDDNQSLSDREERPMNGTREDNHSLANREERPRNGTHDDNHSLSSDSEEKQGNSNGNHDDSVILESCHEGTEEYTYDRAIQNYVNFTETRVKGRNNINEDNKQTDTLTNGHKDGIMKTPPQVAAKPKRETGAKVEERLSLLEERRRSSTDLSSVDKVKLPKVDVLKRREQFEKGDSEVKPSNKITVNNSQSIKERLSSLERQGDANGVKNVNRLSGEITGSIKDRLSSLERQKSTEKLNGKDELTRKRLSNGDLSASQSVKERLTSLQKQGSPESVKEVPANKPAIEVSLRDRLSNLDSKDVKKATPDRDQTFGAKPDDFKREEVVFEASPSTEKPPVAGSERSSSPDEDEIYATKRQQFHRSLDSLDVEGDLGEPFGRVQSLEGLDCLGGGGHYPASASSTEMLAFSSQSGDTDREDSGIHTADVSSSVSQADEDLHLESGAFLDVEGHRRQPSELSSDHPSPLPPIRETEAAETNPVFVDLEDRSQSDDEPLEAVIASRQPVTEAIIMPSKGEVLLENSILPGEVGIFDTCKEIPIEMPVITKVEDVNLEVHMDGGIIEEKQKEVSSLPFSSYNGLFNTKIGEEIFLPMSTTELLPLSVGDMEMLGGGLAFPLAPPSSAEPPKEKPPPPPPPESDDEAPKTKSSLRRVDSTKRIKKEIRRKRSDFLGIEGVDDDSYLEPVLSTAPPDMTAFLIEEQRQEKQLYRQSICSESDSNPGESRDSGVELDRPQVLTPDRSAQHSRQESELYGNASITSEEDEISKKEREIIEILEKEEQWRFANNPSEEDLGEKLAEKLRQLEQEKLRLEWERAEEENRRMTEETLRREEKLRLRAKEQELRQQEHPETCIGDTGDGNNIVEAIRAERERLHREQEQLASQREHLLSQQQVQHGRSWVAGSLQDLTQGRGGGQPPHHRAPPAPPVDHRLSLPDLQEPAGGPRKPPPPVPPSKPLRSPPTEGPPSNPQQMSRQALQALSAAPRPRIVSTDTWIQAKRKPDSQTHGGSYNYQHWLIQEAEHRRITEQQQRNAAPTSPRKSATLPPQSHVSTSPQWHQTQPQQREKPLPDSIIQTLTQRVQNRVGYADKSGPPRRDQHKPLQASPPLVGKAPVQNGVPPAPADPQEKMLSVSGKKKCSHCGDELGRGAAMIIESLRLFYHIDCFKCCVCHVQLGDGLMGTDVRVRNNKLHCHNCYSSDDGVKFSCV